MNSFEGHLSLQCLKYLKNSTLENKKDIEYRGCLAHVVTLKYTVDSGVASDRPGWDPQQRKPDAADDPVCPGDSVRPVSPEDGGATASEEVWTPGSQGTQDAGRQMAGYGNTRKTRETKWWCLKSVRN